LFDGLLALAAAGLSTSLFLSNVAGAGLPATTVAGGYGLVLLHTLPLAARRRFPLVVLASCVASGLAFAVLGLPTVVLGLGMLVAVYTVGAYCERPASLAGLAAAEVALAGVQLTRGTTGVSTWLSNTLVLAAAWLLGQFMHNYRSYAAQLEERTAELERARDELARRAVAEERLRIARELHDELAHSMSVIAVQSGVGAHVAETQPEEARKALAAVEVTSRAALNELRRILGVLRQDSQPQGDLNPVPGLAALDSLVAQLAEVGLAVRLRVEGTRPEVPPSVDLSAYRVVQEALTNVLKHAGPARAQVLVRYGDQEVMVEITDDGRAAAPGATGRGDGIGVGLLGLRERVAAFGGDLEVGPRPEGGFRVAARLPFEAAGP
jgi:signal transduction histidine kinase